MDTAVVECRYRGKVIGELYVGPDGFLRYLSWKMVEEFMDGAVLVVSSHNVT